MHYFVKNPDTNAYINTIHQRVLEGRLDAEIAGLLNKDGIKNLQSSGPWTEDQIEQIRWDYKLDSETPVTIGEKAFRKEQKKSKPGVFWPMLAAAASLIYLIIVYSLAVSEGMAGSKLVVYLLAAIIFPLLIVGLFQVFSRFRNKRPRIIILFWVVLIMIFTNAHKTIMPVLPFIEGRQLPDITEQLDPVTSNLDKYRSLIKAKAQEGITEIKRFYKQQTSGQSPMEAAPDKADETASQLPEVEVEAPEKVGDAENY